MSTLSSLGVPPKPLVLSNILAKAAKLRKCVAFRTPSAKGRTDSSDLYYMTTEPTYQREKKNIEVIPQLHSFGGKANQFLRLQTGKEKKTYNRLGNRKDEWLKLDGPGAVEIQLVSPVGELPGHITWDELTEKAESYKSTEPADPKPQEAATAPRQPFIDERRRPMPKSKRPPGIVYDDDDSSIDGTPTEVIPTVATPFMPLPEPRVVLQRLIETPKPASKSPSLFFHPKSPLFPLVSKQMEAAAAPAHEPTWMQQRNRSPSPTNGEIRTVAAQIIQPASQQTEPGEAIVTPATASLTPAPEVVTMEDAPEETETATVTVTAAPPPPPTHREPDWDAIVLMPPPCPDPRTETVLPPVERLLDPDVNRMGTLLAEHDNLCLTVLRHTNLLHDNRFPVLPVAKLFQVPSMKRIADEELTAELNRIYTDAAMKASEALIRAEVETCKLIRAEIFSFADSFLWTEEEIEAAQVIRASRQDRQKPYKPSNKPPVIFFELVDGAIKPHASAAEAHTTAGRHSDAPAQEPKKKKTAVPPTTAPAAQPSTRTPEEKSAKTRRRREQRQRRAARKLAASQPTASASATADTRPPVTTAPTATRPTAPASNAGTRPPATTTQNAGRSGNGQPPRQTGNRGAQRNHQQRPSVFTRLGPHPNLEPQQDEAAGQHRSSKNNKRIAAIHIERLRYQKERLEFCRQHGIVVQLSHNEKLLEACRKGRTAGNTGHGSSGSRGRTDSRRNY